MKILRLTTPSSSPTSLSSTLQGDSSAARILELHPDSSLIPEGRPMFFPDLGDSWQAFFYLAVRINRLGKRISTRFAYRYYDALALAVAISPGTTADSDFSDLLPSAGWLNVLDNSITHGPWSTPTLSTFSDITAAITSTTATDLPSVHLSAEGLDIDRAVSLCSRYTTLRTGDIILLPLGAALPLIPRTRIIADPALLNLKIV